METVGLQKEEKKLLIEQIVGLAIVALLLLGWTIYIFIGVMSLNFEMMKKFFSSDPETVVYVFGPLLFGLIFLMPRLIKLGKDISSSTVEEGTAEVIKVWNSWLNREWYMTLNEPGREKVKMLRKDAFKLIPGEKIKFRITPSGILIGYEILKEK